MNLLLTGGTTNITVGACITWAGIAIAGIALSALLAAYLRALAEKKKKEEQKARLAASARAILTSPMDGKVLQTKIDIGDTVSKGQVLFVIDACKMEIDVPSTVDGMVKEIITPTGSLVNKGDIMILFY